MNFRLNLATFTFLVLFGGGSLVAQSTSLDSPTQVTSNIVSGSLDKGEKGRNYYYSLMAGPGEVNFTLSIGKAVGGGTLNIFQVGLTILDENEVVLASFSATGGGYSGGQGNQIVTLKRRQRIILQLGHTSFSDAGGEFRLRIGGAVGFEGSTSPSPKGIDSREVTPPPSECLPKRGTLIIKMKDGSKKIIDLTEAETVTVVP
jgi:hypothetical protein